MAHDFILLTDTTDSSDKRELFDLLYFLSMPSGPIVLSDSRRAFTSAPLHTHDRGYILVYVALDYMGVLRMLVCSHPDIQTEVNAVRSVLICFHG
jgi:hypothetical protein